jgi:hypothetical protein
VEEEINLKCMKSIMRAYPKLLQPPWNYYRTSLDKLNEFMAEYVSSGEMGSANGIPEDVQYSKAILLFGKPWLCLHVLPTTTVKRQGQEVRPKQSYHHSVIKAGGWR